MLSQRSVRSLILETNQQSSFISLLTLVIDSCILIGYHGLQYVITLCTILPNRSQNARVDCWCSQPYLKKSDFMFLHISPPCLQPFITGINKIPQTIFCMITDS
uniref:Uncharacterized protein n=1 Tax=Pyxicephalus adspersus TaxID=30357 RepID=A0AAV3AER7_PYXAD|nr:TPA: hypothetical protein GDO54_014406 [Pyxicephalus adspersus]